MMLSKAYTMVVKGQCDYQTKIKNRADFLNYRALHQLDTLWLGDCIFYLLKKGDWLNKVRELRKVAHSSIL
jgi:hypothetical protein